MTQLTTHVLDTAIGKPADGLSIALYRVMSTDDLTLLSQHLTNADGRCDTPLLASSDFKVGQYLLRFNAGDYLRQHHASLAEPLFLDIIDIRFAINDDTTHHHVPLLLSPFGYSTYKGS